VEITRWISSQCRWPRHCIAPGHAFSSAKALLLSNIRSLIEARLTHHDLNAQTVADAVASALRQSSLDGAANVSDALNSDTTACTRPIRS
jgi:hypothetical protein